MTSRDARRAVAVASLVAAVGVLSTTVTTTAQAAETSIYFLKGAGYEQELWRADLRGKKPTCVASAGDQRDDGDGIRSYDVSRDGRFLVQAVDSPRERDGLVLHDLLRGTTRRLTNRQDLSPRFSPDGRSIAFVREPRSNHFGMGVSISCAYPRVPCGASDVTAKSAVRLGGPTAGRSLTCEAASPVASMWHRDDPAGWSDGLTRSARFRMRRWCMTCTGQHAACSTPASSFLIHRLAAVAAASPTSASTRHADQSRSRVVSCAPSARAQACFPSISRRLHPGA